LANTDEGHLSANTDERHFSAMDAIAALGSKESYGEVINDAFAHCEAQIVVIWTLAANALLGSPPTCASDILDADPDDWKSYLSDAKKYTLKRGIDPEADKLMPEGVDTVDLEVTAPVRVRHNRLWAKCLDMQEQARLLRAEREHARLNPTYGMDTPTRTPRGGSFSSGPAASPAPTIAEKDLLPLAIGLDSMPGGAQPPRDARARIQHQLLTSSPGGELRGFPRGSLKQWHLWPAHARSSVTRQFVRDTKAGEAKIRDPRQYGHGPAWLQGVLWLFLIMVHFPVRWGNSALSDAAVDPIQGSNTLFKLSDVFAYFAVISALVSEGKLPLAICYDEALRSHLDTEMAAGKHLNSEDDDALNIGRLLRGEDAGIRKKADELLSEITPNRKISWREWSTGELWERWSSTEGLKEYCRYHFFDNNCDRWNCWFTHEAPEGLTTISELRRGEGAFGKGPRSGKGSRPGHGQRGGYDRDPGPRKRPRHSREPSRDRRDPEPRRLGEGRRNDRDATRGQQRPRPAPPPQRGAR